MCKELVEILLHHYVLFHNIKSTFNQDLGLSEGFFFKLIVATACSELRYACRVVVFQLFAFK